MDIISFYRVERWLFERHIPVLPKIVQLLIFLIFNSKITADSKIGKGSYCVCKGISTVLIPGTEIGENCVLGLRFSTVRQFPMRNIDIVKNVMITEQNEEYTIRAKTGWTRENNINTGWWTGYIETKNGTYIFATRLLQDRKMKRSDFGSCRKEITKKVFKDLNII